MWISLMSLFKYISAVPKAELHVHLEGSIKPSTLLRLAKQNDVDLPVETERGLLTWYSFTTFDHFIEVYITITRCLQTVEDFELIVYEFGAEMARQNILYAEVTFSPSTHFITNGIGQDVWFAGLTTGRQKARKDFGVEINWIFDIVRNDTSSEGRFDYTTSVAIEGKNDGVVALGLGGFEKGYPPDPFAPWFERARSAGLHSVPHAGEMEGPESIWSAILELGAERIGHGVRSIEDMNLVSHLRKYQIPLEISPTSNICLGIYPDMSAHPIEQLHEAGIPIIINSDDPCLFNTTLTDELQLLINPYRFSLESIDKIILNGIHFSFLPKKTKTTMESIFRKEMLEIRNRSELNFLI